MNIREVHINNSDGRLEGILRKTIRHLLSGEVDKATLKRGVKYYKLWIRSRKDKNAPNREILEIKDYAGELGVNVYYYSSETVNPTHHLNIAITEFPVNVNFHCIVIGEDQIDAIRSKSELSSPNYRVKVTNAILSLIPYSICGVIGPTKYLGGSFPNNGFFMREMGGTINPFLDTNPIGQRRGAIAIKKNGDFCILTEEDKLKARKTDFEDYEIVSGTSFYITSKDTDEQVEELGKLETSMCHYLISYEHLNGTCGISVFSAIKLVSRKKVKQILDQHAVNHGWVSYIAAETELNGGGVFFRDDITVLDHEYDFARNGAIQNGTYPHDLLQWVRRDHYVITLKR